MPVSPQEFSLWARMTGNKYPNSVEEKARLAPEVHNFSQNVGKQGALGVQEEPEPEQKSNLGSNLAKGALIAGGIAAGVAAARNPGVQEAVKTASGKASDFLSRITTPREVNVDTAEAVRDVTNSAPGDIYSQAIIPVSQRVEGYEPAGLLKGGGIGGAGDRAQSLIAEIASKYGTNGADEEYVHPSRIPGMPGGDYRGRSFDTEAPSAQLRDARRDNEAGLFNRYQQTGELPPSAVTPEMKAALSQSDVTNALDQIKNDHLLDQKATEGTLTRAEEGAWLQNELNRSGTTPQELFGHDSIEAYMDTYMPKEQSLSNKAAAVISALGAAHPEFGNTVYSQPESVEAANADPGQNPINTVLSGPTTPGNNVPTIQSTNDPGTLTGQHQIQIAADNAVDQVENLSPEDQVRQRAADIAQSTGKVSKVDKFFSPKQAVNLSAKDWVANERGSIQKQIIDSGFKGDPRRLNMLVERELADRMGKDAWTYGPEYTRRRQSIELGLLDPNFLQNPSQPTVEVSGETFDRSEFEKPVAMEATAKRLEERKLDQKDWSGQIHLEQQSTINGIYQERKALAEQQGKQVAKQIEQASAAGDQRTVQALTPQLNNLRELWQDPSKGMHREGEVKLAQARIRGAQRTTEEKIAGMQLPTTLSDWTGEGKRVFFEQDPSTGQVNPATVELRSGNRPSRSSIIEDPQTGEYIETGKAKGSQLQEGEKTFYREQPGETRKPTALEFLNTKKIKVRKPSDSIDVWRGE